ncbi:hypothetical protein GGI03_001495 [Coemansia sp. RSA 2337]|nr:hypothetical protein H4S03_004498 [Coemansia sp. S3946]KAJ2052467.1 hypothetical protein H4S04_001315 [Coemansia sp. S16]KAJ2071553.1 hypothetical protein GGH13_003274 [Coemansia sp. S155-1]KAJ2108739.1 hypothetical protein IW146_006699 [Coemansia sp. RSA 922]KAJ2351438.1 hypothetical protein GGH92_001833 [Coemansia sp. RSA 2673]KAJ2467550.1 hypothetical protein GGI03_001495 [Coemansia sp. RSA 2337]
MHSIRLLVLLLFVFRASSTPLGFTEQAYEDQQRIIPDVTTEELEYWGRYAGAAYDDFEDWETCASCQITKDLGLTKLNTTWSTALPAFSRGFIGINHRRRQIIVSFRGTTHVMNVLADAHVEQAQWPPVKNESYVHLGFLMAYMSARQTVQTAVQALILDMPGYSLTFVGHSLGAAQAVLALVDYCQQAECNNVGLVTFGAPRIGNRVFAQYVNLLLRGNMLWRVVHDSDIVPHLPQSLLLFPSQYVHSDREIWVKDNDRSITVCEPSSEDHAEEDALCSASKHAWQWSIRDHMVYPGIRLVFI